MHLGCLHLSCVYMVEMGNHEHQLQSEPGSRSHSFDSSMQQCKAIII